MKTTLLALALAATLSGCYTTGKPISNDPSVDAAPICQPNYGLAGCYQNGGGGGE